MDVRTIGADCIDLVDLDFINLRYLRNFYKFQQFLFSRGLSFKIANRADALAYVRSLQDQYSPSTVERLVSEMRTIYRKAVELGLSPTNPFACIKVGVPRHANKPVSLSSERIGQQLREIQIVNAIRARDAAIVALVSYDRLSSGQLHCLDISDLNLDAGTAIIKTRGGTKTIFLSDSLPYLRRWLAVRQLYATTMLGVFIALHWTDGRKRPLDRLSERAIRSVRATYLILLDHNGFGETKIESIKKT
jgi:site-specific recombinase XerC